MTESASQKFKKTAGFIFPALSVLIICFGIYLRTRLYLFRAEFWLDEAQTALSFIEDKASELYFYRWKHSRKHLLFSFALLIL